MTSGIWYMLWILMCLSLFLIATFYYVEFKKVISIVNKIDHENIKSFKDLGFVSNNNIMTSSKFMKFLIKKDYEAIGDAELSAASSKCRLLLLIGMFLSVLSFLTPVLIGRFVS